MMVALTMPKRSHVSQTDMVGSMTMHTGVLPQVAESLVAGWRFVDGENPVYHSMLPRLTPLWLPPLPAGCRLEIDKKEPEEPTRTINEPLALDTNDKGCREMEDRHAESEDLHEIASFFQQQVRR